MKRLVTLALLALFVPACGGGGGGRPLPGPPSIVASTGSLLVRYVRPGFASITLTGPGLGDTMSLQGLDYDPLSGELLALDAGTQQLLRIHPTTGAVTPVGITGFYPKGLAFDPASRILYASTLHRHLVRIDLDTGLATDIGPTNGPGFQGLAYDPVGGILYGIEDPSNNLYTLNTITGQATFLMNVPAASGLAFDPNAGLLYAFVTTTHQLVKINPVAMTTTFLGGGTNPDVPGLAYISSSNRLLGVGGSNLYEISLTTGALTWLAQLGLGSPSDLAYDPLVDLFYGVSGSFLCSITPAGAMVRIGPTGAPGPNVTGLAFDPGPRILYATSPSDLLTLDRTTGAATTIGAIGFANTTDLAFDPGTSTLFGSVAAGQLITIDRTTGAGTLVGGLGTGIDSLAIDPDAGTLYATSSTTDTLYTLNKSTAASTPVGPLGASAGSGLDFSTAEGVLYGVPGHLIRINPSTGLATPVNHLGPTLMGQAWDPDLRILYGVSGNTPRLFQIDTTTWVATSVASVATPVLQNGFTFDRDLATLWAIDLNRRLIRINPATGVPTDVGATGIFPTSIAYHPVLGILYAVDLVGSDRLFRLNISTGAATLVGPTGYTDLAGLTYDPASGNLLAYDAGTDQIVEIDPATGAGVALGRARRALTSLVVPY